LEELLSEARRQFDDGVRRKIPMAQQWEIWEQGVRAEHHKISQMDDQTYELHKKMRKKAMLEYMEQLDAQIEADFKRSGLTKEEFLKCQISKQLQDKSSTSLEPQPPQLLTQFQPSLSEVENLRAQMAEMQANQQKLLEALQSLSGTLSSKSKNPKKTKRAKRS
jgi:hypothetical protein